MIFSRYTYYATVQIVLMGSLPGVACLNPEEVLGGTLCQSPHQGCPFTFLLLRIC